MSTVGKEVGIRNRGRLLCSISIFFYLKHLIDRGGRGGQGKGEQWGTLGTIVKHQ